MSSTPGHRYLVATPAIAALMLTGGVGSSGPNHQQPARAEQQPARAEAIWLPPSSQTLPPPFARALAASPHAFFRMANRAWASRVCIAFADDLRSLTPVRLHGDAHVEQYAVTDTGYGLDDFDDTAEGPAVIDLVRFLGSLRLAARERGWSGQVNRLSDAFLTGYRRGLEEPAGLEAAGQGPSVHQDRLVPRVVQRVRQRPIPNQTKFLAWADGLMKPVPPDVATATRRALDLLDAVVTTGAAARPAGYFRIKRLGSAELGIGSRRLPKLLIRVEGPSPAPIDDVILEAKEPANLTGVDCLAPPTQSAAVRVITGTEQIGRLRHDVLSLVPSLIGENPTGHHWWIHDWTPSYVEVDIHSLASVAELAELAQDAGMQLGAARLAGDGSHGLERRRQARQGIAALESRVLQVSERLTNDLLKGWERFRRQR